jgi:hypothetical protein
VRGLRQETSREQKACRDEKAKILSLLLGSVSIFDVYITIAGSNGDRFNGSEIVLFMIKRTNLTSSKEFFGFSSSFQGS